MELDTPRECQFEEHGTHLLNRAASRPRQLVDLDRGWSKGAQYLRSGVAADHFTRVQAGC